MKHMLSSPGGAMPASTTVKWTLMPPTARVQEIIPETPWKLMTSLGLWEVLESARISDGHASKTQTSQTKIRWGFTYRNSPLLPCSATLQFCKCHGQGVNSCTTSHPRKELKWPHCPCGVCLGQGLGQDTTKRHVWWCSFFYHVRWWSTYHHISSHIITYHHISSHIITYHHISSHIITYHHISSHIITYHHISSHIITYHHISSHIITYHHISSHIITYHHISSHIITYHHISITYHHISSHIITYHHISSHIITYHHISSHIITYHHISSHIITYHHISSHIITSHVIIIYIYIWSISISIARSMSMSISIARSRYTSISFRPFLSGSPQLGEDLTKLAEHLRFGDLEAPQRLLEPGSLAREGGQHFSYFFFGGETSIFYIVFFFVSHFCLGGNTSRFVSPFFLFDFFLGNRLEKVCCGVVLKICLNSCNLLLTHGQLGISWLFACGGANRLDSKCGSCDTELSRRDFRNHEPDPSRSCAPKEVKKGVQLLNRSPEPYLPRILQGFLLPRQQRDLSPLSDSILNGGVAAKELREDRTVTGKCSIAQKVFINLSHFFLPTVEQYG